MTVERLEVLHRVKGRPAIIRSTRGLLLRCHRFARARAVTSADLHWCARVIDALDDVLRVMEGRTTDERIVPGRVTDTHGNVGSPTTSESRS